MYLPASPEIGQGLGTSVQAMQGMTVAYLIAFGLFLLALADVMSLWLCIAGLFLANACMGLIIPTAMVLASDDHGDRARLAFSLGGMLLMLADGLLIVAMMPFFDGTATPMLGAIALCGVLALALSRLVRSRQAAALA